MAGPEYRDVEKPFIDQLVGQGWEFLAGSLDDPAATHRESFAQVVMEPLLRQRLRRINLREPHHTPAFWCRLERAMPDYEQRKGWLARHGVEVEGL